MELSKVTQRGTVKAVSSHRRVQESVDVEFESVVDTLHQKLKTVRSAEDQHRPADELLRDVCRFIRFSKFVFADVVRSYRSYRGNCQDYVELVTEAALTAARVTSGDLVKSLQRHADEIQSRQAQYKDAA